jgi:hypothetical protein
MMGLWQLPVQPLRSDNIVEISGSSKDRREMQVPVEESRAFLAEKSTAKCEGGPQTRHNRMRS